MADPPSHKQVKPKDQTTEAPKDVPEPSKPLPWLRDHQRMRVRQQRVTHLRDALERIEKHRQLFRDDVENVYAETDQARAFRKYREPDALQILNDAKGNQSLNPPKLAREINAYFARKRSKQRVDRATVYRILTGKTTRPNPATVNALIHVLKLPPQSAQVVRRQLGLTEKF
jgi:hypothetical protein